MYNCLNACIIIDQNDLFAKKFKASGKLTSNTHYSLNIRLLLSNKVPILYNTLKSFQ